MRFWWNSSVFQKFFFHIPFNASLEKVFPTLAFQWAATAWKRKKKLLKNWKNSENVDCFGIRTSNMNVFDKKTWPTPPGTTPTGGSRKIYSLVRELKGKSPTGFWFELSNQQGILLWYCNWKGSRKDRSRFFIKHILFGDLIPKQSKFLGVFQVFEEFFFPFHPVAQKFPPLP